MIITLSCVYIVRLVSSISSVHLDIPFNDNNEYIKMVENGSILMGSITRTYEAKPGYIIRSVSYHNRPVFNIMDECDLADLRRVVVEILSKGVFINVESILGDLTLVEYFKVSPTYLIPFKNYMQYLENAHPEEYTNGSEVEQKPATSVESLENTLGEIDEIFFMEHNVPKFVFDDEQTSEDAIAGPSGIYTTQMDRKKYEEKVVVEKIHGGLQGSEPISTSVYKTSIVEEKGNGERIIKGRDHPLGDTKPAFTDTLPSTSSSPPSSGDSPKQSRSYRHKSEPKDIVSEPSPGGKTELRRSKRVRKRRQMDYEQIVGSISNVEESTEKPKLYTIHEVDEAPEQDSMMEIDLTCDEKLEDDDEEIDVEW